MVIPFKRWRKNLETFKSFNNSEKVLSLVLLVVASRKAGSPHISPPDLNKSAGEFKHF